MKRLISTSLISMLFIPLSFPQHVKAKKTSQLHLQGKSLRSPQTVEYTLTTLIEPYTDLTDTISLNNGEIWDEPMYVVPMAFPFQLNGHPVTTFHFNGSGSKMASTTSDPFVFTLLLPFENDLIDRGANGNTSLSPISYKVDGSPGSQVQKIEFKNAGSYYEMDSQGTLNMFVNFQCWIYEGSNTVEFRYGPSFIDNPTLFYAGSPGPTVSLADRDEFDHVWLNAYFLSGSASNPVISPDPIYLGGTPANGTVYRYTLHLPLEIMVTGEDGTSACNPNGSATVLATGGTEPYTYVWNTGQTTSTINNLNTGIYEVTVQDADGSTATGNVSVFNPDTLTINVTSTNETSVGANDGTAGVSATGGLLPFIYLWSNGDTTAVIDGLAPGIYTITVTDASDCTAAQTVTINAFVCPNLTIEAGISNPSCFGDCNGSISVLQVGQGVAPFLFEWSQGGSTSFIQNLCAAEYALTVTDAAGCIISESYEITQPDSLQIHTGWTDESQQNLNDGTAWTAPSGGTPPYSYAWNTGSMDSLITNLSPGNYTVTVTDTLGCESMDSVVVNAFVCFGPPETFIENHSCLDSCAWSISNLMVSGGVGPFTYLWSTGDTTQTSIDSLCPGTYILTITDEGQQCAEVDSFQILTPEPLVAMVDEVIHLTDSTTTAISISVVSGPPPYFFYWYGPNGFYSMEEDLTGIAPGFYSVQIQNSFGACTILDSIEVLDNTVSTYLISGFNISIFPNPASEKVLIQIAEVVDFKVELFSAHGLKVLEEKNETELNVQVLSVGFYILKFTSGDNYFIHPMIIQR